MTPRDKVKNKGKDMSPRKKRRMEGRKKPPMKSHQGEMGWDKDSTKEVSRSLLTKVPIP